MPRIDPTQLLSTLSVLLAPSGGIKSSDEVSRLVQLMQKFSKKLVSKVIYVNILKASSPDLLDRFLGEKGWELLNFWFSEAIKTSNWALCAELTQLFSKCPMTAQRLKENVDQNLAPKLIRQLSCDSRVEVSVRQLANQVLGKWVAVVQPTTEVPESITPEPTRTTRGTRSHVTVKPTESSGDRVPVIVDTCTENIVNMDFLTTTLAGSPFHWSTIGGQVWVGKGKSGRGIPERWAANVGRAIMSVKRPSIDGESKAAPVKKVAKVVPKVVSSGRSKEFIDSDDSSDEEFTPSSDPFDVLVGNTKDVLKESVKVSAVSPHLGIIRNESLENVDELLSDDDKPVRLLNGMANELSESIRKDAVDVFKHENSSVQKTKQIKREKDDNREERRDKEKERHKDKYKDKHREKDRDKERERRKDEERRRREKEREKLKKEERKEKRRESKPYRETEMRDGLDSSEKQRIKELAQRMREETQGKKEDFKPAPMVSSLARIPKIPKKEDEKNNESKIFKKEDSKIINKDDSKVMNKDDSKILKKDDSKIMKKSNTPSFEDLMFAMDKSSAKPIKAPPIKNKNKDLLASISNSNDFKPSSKSLQEIKNKVIPKKESRSEFLGQIKTEDKSSKIIKSETLSKLMDESKSATDRKPEINKEEIHKIESKEEAKKEEIKPEERKKMDEKKEEIKNEVKTIDEAKKAAKRPSTDGEAKIKIKPVSQLVESSMFGDILSTIMKDQPKKKKIKLADLKAQKEAKSDSDNIMKSDSDEEKENGMETKNPAPVFSFYRDTMEEEKNNELTEVIPNDDNTYENVVISPIPETANDADMPFEEPKVVLPREVRGILVYVKGAKRNRRIQWRPDDSLVEVEYFELDETERVNVNKLKFEEQKKREAEFEKSSMLKKQNEGECMIPWPGLSLLECELPEIEYGGNSTERKSQEQRENTVLKALFFNNKLLSDPVEPDMSGVGSGETKHIPLEDLSGEEEFKDYSEEGWPPTLDELCSIPQVDVLTSLNNPNILQNLLGGAMSGATIPETGNSIMNDALFAAQKAAQDTLRAHGQLPPLNEEPLEDQPPLSPPPMVPPPNFDNNENKFVEHEHSSDIGFYPPPHLNGTWSGGPQQRGGPPRPPHPDFRGGFRPPGNGPPVRDFRPPNFNHRGRSGGFHHRGNIGRGDDRRDGGFKRPCRFWVERGFCRDGDRCKFHHPPR